MSLIGTYPQDGLPTHAVGTISLELDLLGADQFGRPVADGDDVVDSR
jgi:hypothetical protein